MPRATNSLSNALLASFHLAEDLEMEVILALPHVSHEAVDLMQQRLLCEPEDRLGPQRLSSVVRPNSMIMEARRSDFTAPSGATRGGDSAEVIKSESLGGAFPFPVLRKKFPGRHVHSCHYWDWAHLHRYPTPFHPKLHNPEDMRHFDGYFQSCTGQWCSCKC